MQLAVKNRVLDIIAELPEPQAANVTEVLEAIPAEFGRPHLHGGLGIRHLRPGIYEARVGLDLPAVFTREGDWLRVQFLGNHDAVRRWLRK